MDVEIPELGTVEFPDTMSQDEINAAAMRLYRENLLKQQGEIRAAPSAPVAFAQHVLQESGLPASVKGVEALPEQGFLRNLLLPLGVINAPFQAVGEAAQAAAEKLGATPPNPENVLSQILSPRTLATLGTSYAVPAAINAVRYGPEYAAHAIGSMFPGTGPIGKVPFPAAPLSVAAKRAYEEPPQMVRTAPLAPPILPGAPGEGLPLLQPGVLPSQIEAGMAAAGMRGPGLLSATEQPIITSAPARIGRGTSEIVDEFGRSFPTRPPQHIEPADALLPPTTGPLSGQLTSAATAATRRRGLPSLGEVLQLPEEQLNAWNQLMREGGFSLAGQVPRLASGAIGAVGGGRGGASLGETPEEKTVLGLTGAVVGGAAGFAAPGVLSRWNQRIGKQIEWAERANVDVFSRGPELTRAEALKVKQAMPGPLPEPQLVNAVSAINDTLSSRGAFVATAGVGRGSVPTYAPLTLRLTQAIENDPTAITALGANLKARGSSFMDVAQLLVDSSQNTAQLLRRSQAMSRVLEQDALSNPQAAALLHGILVERPALNHWDVAGHMLRRSDNVWRGLLVAAWRTAERNALLQQIRVLGIEAFEHMIDGTIMKATGVGPTSEQGITAGARYAWEYLMIATPKARHEIDAVLEAFPAFRDKLLQLYSSDVARHLSSLGPGLARMKGGELRPMGQVATQVDRLFNGADVAVKGLNALNRGQEVLTRKAAMRASLLGLLEQRGIHNLDQIPLNQIPVEDVARAVDHALKMTFAESPMKDAPNVIENLLANVLEKTGKSGTLAVGLHMGLGVPFVRYLFNAGRFVAERPYTSIAPAMRTLWRLTSAAERAKMTRGDISAVTRMVEGSLGLLAGWQFVNSDLVGDGVLEAKVPGLGPINLALLGPIIPAYVLPARMLKEWQQGTLPARWPEFVRAASDLRHRAEDLSVGVDAFIKAIPQLADAAPEFNVPPASVNQTFIERVGTTAKDVLDIPTRMPRRFAGETLAGTMQFLTTLQRLFAAYGKHIPGLEDAAREENTKRDLRGSPFTGPMLARMPVAGRSLGLPNASQLPPQASSLRSGPIPIETPPTFHGFPLPADIIGIQAAPSRTPIETEALKLGLTPREQQGQATAYPEADLMIRREVGNVAGPLMNRIVASPGYERLDPKQRVVATTMLMEKIREEVRKDVRQRIQAKVQGRQALNDEERGFLDAWIKASVDPRMRELLRARGYRVPR